jgi:Na+-transporting NADH:ubiquinone oxidoreductase subunit NqrF
VNNTEYFLYLVERTDEADWDEYRGFIVSAENEGQAKSTPPDKEDFENPVSSVWVTPDRVKVTLIGKSFINKHKVVLTDFKAG